MYENSFNIEIKKKQIDIVKQNKKSEILYFLNSELKEIKINKNITINFCSCGYPISYKKNILDNENNILETKLLEDILKEEVDFDSYTICYYCPNCNKLIEERKY
jgi:hypothetical protein